VKVAKLGRSIAIRKSLAELVGVDREFELGSSDLSKEQLRLSKLVANKPLDWAVQRGNQTD
jgi:hypothetical protein